MSSDVELTAGRSTVDRASPPPTILRRKQVEARTGLARSTIYDKLDPNSSRYDRTFPRQVSLGARSSVGKSGAVGWIESEVTTWLENRIQACRNGGNH